MGHLVALGARLGSALSLIIGRNRAEALLVRVCCVSRNSTILSVGRGDPQSVVHLWQIIIGLVADGLILDSLVGFIDDVKDLFADDLWLGRLECVWIQLVLHGDRYAMLLPCQVYWENTVNLNKKGAQVSVGYIKEEDSREGEIG